MNNPNDLRDPVLQAIIEELQAMHSEFVQLEVKLDASEKEWAVLNVK